jgi:hypothetical protein
MITPARRMALRVGAASLALAALSCAPAAKAPSADQVFWDRLEALCGNAYEGTVVEAPAGDTTFAGKSIVMHVRSCEDDRILIPLHVGSNRSRTWVLTRVPGGLRLKHDHRHEDGVEDSVTQYGGDSPALSDPGRAEFRADAFTAELIPAAATNVWTIEIEPGVRFVYALRREGTDRRFRLEFDLTQPVPAPPPAWGTTAGS